ncbi:hypothetical protein HMPREF9120_02313 [Neisseria sp. oral taxon 020 str. F0370]|nr:hypothetical protein HMPREF9120_02313 [Neisseria sp. oral taxon 020 str. F0370]
MRPSETPQRSFQTASTVLSGVCRAGNRAGKQKGRLKPKIPLHT